MGNIARIPTKSMESLVSPTLTKGTEKLDKGTGVYFSRIFKNFCAMAEIRLHRITTLFSSGGWVSNKEIRKQLSERIIELTTQLQTTKEKIATEKLEEMASEIKTLQQVCTVMFEGRTPEKLDKPDKPDSKSFFKRDPHEKKDIKESQTLRQNFEHIQSSLEKLSKVVESLRGATPITQKATHRKLIKKEPINTKPKTREKTTKAIKPIVSRKSASDVEGLGKTDKTPLKREKTKELSKSKQKTEEPQATDATKTKETQPESKSPSTRVRRMPFFDI